MTDDFVTWYVTFGFGGPHGGQYTEVQVPASLSRGEQNLAVRTIAFAHYRKQWAFEYPPEDFARSIAGYGMTRRETLTYAPEEANQ